MLFPYQPELLMHLRSAQGIKRQEDLEETGCAASKSVYKEE